MGNDHNELRKTIIHELLHYYQSDYDKRYAMTKAHFEGNGEFLMMYESGGGWIERLVADHSYSKILIINAEELLKFGFDGIPKGGNEFQSKGYGMGLILEWLSQKKGDESIVTLYEHWRDKGIKTTREWIEDWSDTYDYDFFDNSNFRDFIEESADGKVVKGFNFFLFPDSNIGHNITNQTPKYGEYDIWRYGSRKSMYAFNYWVNSEGTKDVKGRQLTITQTDESIYGLAYICEVESYEDEEGKLQKRPKTMEFLGYFTSDNPLVVTDESILNKLVSKKPITHLYTVAAIRWNTYDVKAKQTVSLSAQEPTLSLDRTELSFTADGGEKQIVVTTNCTDVRVTQKPDWCSVSISENILTLKAEKNTTTEKRDGSVIIMAGNSVGEVPAEVKVTQAGKTESTFIPLMDRTNYTQAYVRVKGTSMKNTGTNGEKTGGISGVNLDFTITNLDCVNQDEYMLIKGTMEVGDTTYSGLNMHYVITKSSCEFTLDKKNGIILTGAAHYDKLSWKGYYMQRILDYTFMNIPIDTKGKTFYDGWMMPSGHGDYFRIQSIIRDGLSHYTEEDMGVYVPSYSFYDKYWATPKTLYDEPQLLNAITGWTSDNRFEVEIRLLLPE